MLSVRKVLYGAGAVAAAAALVVVGANVGSRGADPVSLAEDDPAAQSTAMTSQKLKSMLLPASAHPAGSTITEMTLSELVAAGYNQPPPDLIINPALCADGLSDGVGDPTKTLGWAQIGTTPEGSLFVGVAAYIEDGARFDRIRQTIAKCTAATVTLTSYGVTGTMKLSEIPGPVLLGAQTIGVQATTTFETEVPDGAALLVEALNSTTIYVAQGSTLLEICEKDPATAAQSASAMYNLAAGVL